MKRAISNIISSIVKSDRLIGGAAVELRPSSRAKRLRLKVDPRTRCVVLVVPRRLSVRRAWAWAEGHGDWIAQKLAELPPPTPVEAGALIPYRGEPHELAWSPESPRRVRVEGGRILIGGPAEGLNGRLLRWLRGQALALLREETADYAAKAGVMATKVGVGDPVSRWGSCSSRGAIRYSWRLILAPDFVRRATVAHEVAHLVHLNHGPDFHALAEKLFEADPRPARDWLRRNGASLHAIGRVYQ